LVKTATSNSMPSTRDSESAWEDTSIAAPATPAWTMRPRRDWSSSASGVVWLAASAWAPTRYWIVPITPVGRPPAPSRASTSSDVVVLPLVPVMPTTVRRRDG
jgi:hypothetical protein